MPMHPTTNPFGNGYEVRSTEVTKSTHIDASTFTNRVVKIINPSKLNAVSGKPVGFKFAPSPTQLILADPNSVMAHRAKFAAHHVRVTKHVDYEFWAGGEFTNQSEVETGGCYDAAAQRDDVENRDVVVWNVFGFTHNPRVEDLPVIPIEKHEVHLRPADFFEANPSLDVPSQRNMASALVSGNGNAETRCTNGHDSGATNTRSHADEVSSSSAKDEMVTVGANGYWRECEMNMTKVYYIEEVARGCRHQRGT